jgi:hypothetical protein
LHFFTPHQQDTQAGGIGSFSSNVIFDSTPEQLGLHVEGRDECDHFSAATQGRNQKMSTPENAQPVNFPPVTGVRTNALAVISLVTSVLGLGLVGVITGHIGLSQIKTSHEQGRGLALAGVIVGYVGVGLWVIGVGLVALYSVMFLGD